jgi:tRNA dimethylallyltransferase
MIPFWERWGNFDTMKNDIIVITGPTASGKTGLSVALAKKLNTEIVSADSMQLYENMDIGTAKVTASEMQGVKHHMVDCVSPMTNYSVNDYVCDATVAIDGILEKGKTPIIVGGTGLYINSLIYNFNLTEAKSDLNLRAELENETAEKLLTMLTEFDPETAKKLHPNNKRRIVRAIEMYKTSGITMSEQIEITKKAPQKYSSKIFALTMDREKLYDRINLRVDTMIEKGLVIEVQKLLKMGIPPTNTAMQAIGYKEIVNYINHEISLDEAIEIIKQESRRYAKRQLTWFRRDGNVQWINVDEYENVNDIIRKIMLYLSN